MPQLRLTSAFPGSCAARSEASSIVSCRIFEGDNNNSSDDDDDDDIELSDRGEARAEARAVAEKLEEERKKYVGAMVQVDALRCEREKSPGFMCLRGNKLFPS